MQIHWNHTYNDLCVPYIENLRDGIKNARELTTETRNLLICFFNDIDQTCRESYFEPALRYYFHQRGVWNTLEFLEHGLRPAIDYLFGSSQDDAALCKEWTALFSEYIRLDARAPYTTGYTRHSIRSIRLCLHIGKIAQALRQFVLLRATGFTTSQILRKGRTPEEQQMFSDIITIDDWLAAKIASGDRECIDYLTEAMTSENNANRMYFDHFRAISLSSNKELLILEGKLLLAARMQEGLRQAIVETMDEGQPESFIYLLKVIIDNNLQRFSAVKRGLAVATGFGDQDAADRITEKFFSLVFKLVSDRDEAVRAIDSNDPMTVYLALWSIAFFDADSVKQHIAELLEHSPAHIAEATTLIVGYLQDVELINKMTSLVLRVRTQEHRIIAGLLEMYLRDTRFHLYLRASADEIHIPDLSFYFESREDAETDFALLTGIYTSVKSAEVFEPYVFPWIGRTLTKSLISEKICRLALLLATPDYAEKALDYFCSLEPYDRGVYLKYILYRCKSRRQIEFAVAMMADKGNDARDQACRIVRNLHEWNDLADEDYLAMESHLRLKAAPMRTCIIGILGSLPDDKAISSVKRLITDKSTERRLAGLDILKNWIDKGERSEAVSELKPELSAIVNPTSREQILLGAILAQNNPEENIYTPGNGFGLYSCGDEIAVSVTRPADFSPEKALAFKSDSNILKKILRKRNSPAVELIQAIIDLIEKNTDYEFKDRYGNISRLGNTVQQSYKPGLESIALPEIWKEFYDLEIGSPENILRLWLATITPNASDKPFYPTLKRILGRAFDPDILNPVKNSPYFQSALHIITALAEEYCKGQVILEIATNFMSDFALRTKAEDCIRNYQNYSWESPEDQCIYNVQPVATLLSICRNSSNDMPDDLFLRSFAGRHNLLCKTKSCIADGFNYRNPLNAMEYLRAWSLGAISDKAMFREMMSGPMKKSMIAEFSQRLPDAEKPRWAKQLTPLSDRGCHLINTVIERILDIELKRGDSETPVSSLAYEIRCVSGIDRLLQILQALGKDKPVTRGYYANLNKREILSSLLQASSPAPSDSPEELKRKAKVAGVTDEQLAEAAMFSQRWLEITEEAIGWKGLTSGAYYFMAHTADTLSDRAKSRISRYSAVEPADFADGACDPAWFHEIYKTLGRKHYEFIYASAKHVADGNRHSRSRKLSDALLGNLKAKQVMKEISEKRNKDLVVALGLIPLGRNKHGDLRERYIFLNKFLKDSKQFGAQRQASEGRAVKLALDNLARTAGYGDSTRLTWSMEAALVKDAAQLLTPKDFDGVSVRLHIGDGMPEIICESKGKILQNIPSRLKKDPYVISLKETCKQLKEQHIRGRALLEQAMVESSEFTGAEISSLKENPIIWSLFSRLVLVRDNGCTGFPGDDGVSIISAEGEYRPLSADDRLRIAHPYDLFSNKEWSAYQALIFEHKWKQPFKQVFRELYVPTPEEKDMSKSMRYSGNQIMPSRTAALLKKRQWTVDYDCGLQKICFNSNVTAVLYAMADWFSPADIEAPTLEYVEFHDRRTFKDKKISEIPPIAFSEIMRDVDLAVSVAHAGSVDPETSHSTIEMRRAIVSHTLPMFGINNVSLSDTFAKVSGQLGRYNIHLGSGTIHKEGGAQIAVLPVHSQSRGRIFLPFLDEDPKTAEIISKILLFSDDAAIKDPSILRQL